MAVLLFSILAPTTGDTDAANIGDTITRHKDIERHLSAFILFLYRSRRQGLSLGLTGHGDKYADQAKLSF